MTVRCSRPVGSPADVSELEYLSALQQTEKDTLRLDASITAKDVRRYLKSRHGIRVRVGSVRRDIVGELAGCGGGGGGGEGSDQKESSGEPGSKKIVEDDDVEAPRVSARERATDDGGGGGGDDDDLSSVDDDGGGGSQQQGVQQQGPSEPRIDLVQMSALILLPTLCEIQARARARGAEEEGGGGGEKDGFESGAAGAGEDGSGDGAGEDNDNNDGNDGVDEKDLVDTVLMLMLEQSRLEHGAELNRATLRRLLHAYGEDANVRPPADEDEDEDALLDGMLEHATAAAANTTTTATTPRLNRECLLRALTSDVAGVYDVNWSETESTIYQDARTSTYSSSRPSAGAENKETAAGGEGEDGPLPLDRFYTAPHIDSAADTYMSFSWHVAVWFTMAVTFFAYMFNGILPHEGFPPLPCESHYHNYTVEYVDLATGQVVTVESAALGFGCAVGKAIVSWLEIFLELATLGFLFLFCSTLGNSVYYVNGDRRAVAVVYTMVTYGVEVDTEFFSTHKTSSNRPAALVSLVLGCLLVLIQLYQVLRLLFFRPAQVSSNGDRSSPKCCSYGILRSERNLKQAAIFKANRMVQNALDCHAEQNLGGVDPKQTEDDPSCRRRSSYHKVKSSLAILAGSRTPTTEAMVRYHKKEHDKEEIGGVAWTWRKLWDKSLLREEGVWIFPRLVTANSVQWVVVVAFLAVAAFGVRWIYANEQTWGRYQVTDIELTIALLVGLPAALAGSIGTAVVYIPSAVSTVLRYRSGLLGSLRDRDFLQCRYAIDNTNLLFGAAFWASIASGAVFWFVVGGITFLLVWNHQKGVIQAIIANLIGVFCTIVIKIVILQCFRVQWYGAFYRRRPAAVNILNAVDESWNLGLSTWTIFVRALRLIVVSIFYIGRLDTPILAPGVGWIMNKFPMDTLPFIFRKDLLIHDAHRHPFIERLGLLYMLKLRHGRNFGTRPGAAWRILFTLALMPWLRKYRIYPAVTSNVTTYKEENDDEFDDTRDDVLLASLKELKQKNAEMKRILEGLGITMEESDDGSGEVVADDSIRETPQPHPSNGGSDCGKVEVVRGEEANRWLSAFFTS